ncbi:MAG: alpha/beta hydrolase, partial [Flavobacteriaceae bacterium]|nr:alpha/beta hydrolase [Flavobacteriaceae bacterium]
MKNLLFLILFSPLICFSQTTGKSGKDISVSPMIEGTILVPETDGKPALAILIGGSGPTDRNGNQSMMKNNSLRFLAEGLYENGIAVFRYDKRILKQLKEKTLTEEAIRFDDFIKDAKDVVAFFKRSNAFSKIYVIGHSQGSLVGMIAAQNGIDGFISIAGAGQEIDDVIVDQIAIQSPGLKDNARTAFDDMRANGITVRFSQGLASIFRPQIQPFMISWMKYNPQTEIAKLQIPVLIINGE